VDVSIGGQTLVSGDQVLDTLQTYDAGGGQLLVQTATGGVNLTLTGGSIQGTIDARDGELATMQSSINTLASTLITQVNTIQSSGYSLTGTTGANFFDGSDAATITVNAALADNPSLIQASGSATATGDNSVALQLADLASTTQSGLNNQTFGDSYDETVANLGDSLQTANDQVTNQTAVSNMLSTQRSSVSGVNVDEEMTNLMGFQRAYEASAQLVTTLNTMLGDVLAMKTS
jgi:flagellar hook-associated protein 1 FlgK